MRESCQIQGSLTCQMITTIMFSKKKALAIFKERKGGIMRKQILMGLLTLGMLFQYLIAVPGAYGTDEKGGKYPYGGSREGEYGEKKEVLTPGDAERILRQYFSKKNVTIGEIREKELYFEAEVRDENNKVIDKVIVDKRTGRIRSIY